MLRRWSMLIGDADCGGTPGWNQTLPASLGRPVSPSRRIPTQWSTIGGGSRHARPSVGQFTDVPERSSGNMPPPATPARVRGQGPAPMLSGAPVGFSTPIPSRGATLPPDHSATLTGEALESSVKLSRTLPLERCGTPGGIEHIPDRPRTVGRAHTLKVRLCCWAVVVAHVCPHGRQNKSEHKPSNRKVLPQSCSNMQTWCSRMPRVGHSFCSLQLGRTGSRRVVGRRPSQRSAYWDSERRLRKIRCAASRRRRVRQRAGRHSVLRGNMSPKYRAIRKANNVFSCFIARSAPIQRKREWLFEAKRQKLLSRNFAASHSCGLLQVETAAGPFSGGPPELAAATAAAARIDRHFPRGTRHVCQLIPDQP